VKCFWTQSPEVPSHIGIFQVCLRVSLLAVNEIRELDRVSDEEDRGVVSNHIIDTLFSIELDCESSRVSFSIC
jgi:hypothetical protein